MVSTFIGLLDIQSWWEIPCIAHFCSLFSSAFNLPDIDIEDLESALLTDGTDDTVGLLPELIVGLLKGCDELKNRDEITTSNYQMFLRRFLRHQCRQFNTENYFDTDIDFQSLPVRNKLLILHSLCHFRLDSKNVQDILGNLEADSLRVEPLGYDSKNSGYWYFYGTRLYREDTPGGKSTKSTVWQVICFTEEDWQNLSAKFKDSASPQERALYNILVENFLPKLSQLFRERERLRRRKLLQVRNSVRIRNLVEEKDRQASQKAEAELIQRQLQRQKLKEEIEATNRIKPQPRRRSISSSTASGISTYASSIKASCNSSDFLYQREKFCLSPGFIQLSPRESRNSEDEKLDCQQPIFLDRNDKEQDLPATESITDEHKSVATLKRKPNRKRKSSQHLSQTIQASECSNDSQASINQENKENCCKTKSKSINDSDTDNVCQIRSNSKTSIRREEVAAIVVDMAPTTNVKLPGRQTNNSLSSLTGNIFIPPTLLTGTNDGSSTNSATNAPRNSSGGGSGGNSKPKEKAAASSSSNNAENVPRKKKNKSSEVIRSNSPAKIPLISFTETDEVLQIGMHKVLVYVKNHRDAWPFMDPVEEDIAPRYYTIIRRPMDLLKMEEKLDNGEYTKFSEFRNDFKLIVNNCRLYNGQNNEYTEMVNNLQEAFDKGTKKYFDQNSSDEDANLEYPDSKTNVFREKYFNKNNSTKIIPKEVTGKKVKEKLKSSDMSISTGKTVKSVEQLKAKTEERHRETEMEATTRVAKRKRKDKDKRRKKKSKSMKITPSDEEENEEVKSEKVQLSKADLNDSDVNSEPEQVEEEPTKKKSDKGKTIREKSPSPPPAKKPKIKSSSKDPDKEVKDKKSTSRSKSKSSGGSGAGGGGGGGGGGGKKIEEDKAKKASKSGKHSKGLSKKQPSDEKAKPSQPLPPPPEDHRSEKDLSSDHSLIDYPTRNKGKSKHSSAAATTSGHHKSKTNTNAEKNKSTNSSISKTKSEKENQNTKSKASVKPLSSASAASSSSLSVGKGTEQSSNNLPYDNKTTTSKKKKSKSSKSEKLEKSEKSEKSEHAQPPPAKVEDSPKLPFADSDRDLSRSPSPVFKVDLHKKYAKSASSKTDEIFSDSKKKSDKRKFDTKKSSTTTTTTTPVTAPPATAAAATAATTEQQQEEDSMSISSRSLSRSPSPFDAIESDIDQDGKAGSKSSSSDNKKKSSKTSETQNQSHSVSSQEADASKFPLFMDKYDLIKQRRNRNTEEKWNQIVKEAEKIKDNKKITTSKPSVSSSISKEKNQKLKETIEKLKVKNAKSKERSVLIDEIFGVKPTQEIRDEKTIFEKLRETCLDAAKSPTGAAKRTEAIKNAIPSVNRDEYDFVDELVASRTSVSVKKEDPVAHEKLTTSSSSKKHSSGKKHSGSSKKNTNNKTNMEALELETEQTLKDINRWLEHTPRFPEFSSASNSPSRYNLLDDFDAVAAKLDPADFRRPVPISTAKNDPVPKLTDTFEEVADTKKDDIVDFASATTVDEVSLRSLSTISLPPTATVTLIPPAAVPVTVAGVSPTAVTGGTIAHSTVKPKDTNQSNVPNTTQLLAHPPPPPPHVKTQQQKENKRKTLKEKLTSGNRRKDLLRTIDRLQPGKSKGNLLGNIHNTNKPDELFPLGAAAKIKEVKNALVVKTDESGPKLSLGSVLHTEGFGLGQLHNFNNDIASGETRISEAIETSNTEMDKKKDFVGHSESIFDKIEDADKKESEVEPKTEPVKTEKHSATPNLSAWFKAFGAPKKPKKSDEEEKKIDICEGLSASQDKQSQESPGLMNAFGTLKSPSGNENFSLPAPRQRKASTGSTISERSSFSQDPDSPRVGIDDRFGTFSGPYASPLGASPIMVSPKPDDITKPTSPYPLNGAIKVGFYQDTTTKSSPEKSCSPRELPSPYPQYSQHLYSSGSSPNVNAPEQLSSSYTNCYNSNTQQNKTDIPGYSGAASTNLYDQYKQPASQESDYNSSMSPNPNSPYQQSQNSPYQSQNSPYQQTQNSPYQQPQNSPFQGQQQTANTPQPHLTAHSPNPQPVTTVPPPSSSQQQQQSQQQTLPQQQQQQSQAKNSQAPNSPYQQPTNSPYQQPGNSPYQQNPTSPYQQQQQQSVLGFGQQQSQQTPGQPAEPQVQQSQEQSADAAFSQASPQFSMHDNTQQYQQPNQNPVVSYEQEINKRNAQQGMKMSSQPEWGSQMEMPVVPTQQQQQPQASARQMTALGHHMTSGHGINQLNTPPMQADQMNPAVSMQQQAANKTNLQFPTYSQFNQGDKDPNKPPPHSMYNNPMGMDLMQTQNALVDVAKANQQQVSNVNKRPQANEPEMINMGYSEPMPPKIPKIDRSQQQLQQQPPSQQQQLQQPPQQQIQSQQQHQQKPFDTTLSKQQQMFDSFLGSMAGKNIGFSKPLDISASKAFEMFNRAATMGFPKDFPNTLIGNKPEQQQQQQQQQHQPGPVVMSSNNVPQQIPQSYHMGVNKPMDVSITSNANNANNKPINMVSNSYSQAQHQQHQQHMQTLPSASEANKLHQHQQQQQQQQQQPQSIFAQAKQMQEANYATNLVQTSGADKMPNDLVIPNPRQEQLAAVNRNQHLNMDLSNYKPTYNNPAAMLDPLRNLNHPLSMMDESMLGLQTSTATGYYDKNIPPAHLFSKNIGQQMFQNPSHPYMSRDQQSAAQNYATHVPQNAPPPPQVQAPPEVAMGIDPKVVKRTKKKKSATPTPLEMPGNQNTNALLAGQQQLPIQSQGHPSSQNPQNLPNPQQQGFQLYAGLKTAATSVSGPTDTSAISLKTAASMVPGSAFNFGPSPTGLGLSTGIYGDNSGYLVDDFRAASNAYYMPPGHRSTPDGSGEKASNAGAPAAPYQFLTHTPARTSYPFMNSPQLDPNSPIYQQYLQRQQEELRARMMLNQGLLGPGAPTGYPQTGYRPPTLGMPKPYDMNTMNRQPWF